MHSSMPFHFSTVFQLFIIGIMVYFTVKMIRRPAPESGPDSPQEVLRRRYALGEIDEQTYRIMKEELK